MAVSAAAAHVGTGTGDSITKIITWVRGEENGQIIYPSEESSASYLSLFLYGDSA